MTTVAWDGKIMAADTLATDAWGLVEEVLDKIHVGSDFLLAGAGEHGAIQSWWKAVSHLDAVGVLAFGYPVFAKETNDPAMMLACASGVYRHVSGGFFKCSRGFHAIGSGRDYALAAMRCGRSAEEAVSLAMEFDRGTGGFIIAHKLNEPTAAPRTD